VVYPPYIPIACALHDSLELSALRRVPREIEFYDGAGERRIGTFLIRSIRSRDGAEWLVTEPPAEIRLDLIERLDGARFGGEC
jgi:transcriptional antiterminator Rof (Rho-off)